MSTHAPTRAASPEYRWSDLLDQALQAPGTIAKCYSAFWTYSLGNQLAAYLQCLTRGIAPGPLATYPGWQTHGRQVRKGEAALWLCQPISGKRASADAEQEAERFTYFVWKPRWFTLAQTDPIEGREYTPPALPDWDRARALAALAIREVPFTSLDGNTQGYSTPDGTVAISPLAGHPVQTLFHEIGHIIAGHFAESATLARPTMEIEAEAIAYLCSDALGLDGAEEARGYLQEWHRRGGVLDEPTARRIMQAADKILAAGRPATRAEEE